MFVRFVKDVYIWNGPGRTSDSMWVRSGSTGTVIGTFKWREAINGFEDAFYVLLDDGRVGWTPTFDGVASGIQFVEKL